VEGGAGERQEGGGQGGAPDMSGMHGGRRVGLERMQGNGGLNRVGAGELSNRTIERLMQVRAAAAAAAGGLSAGGFVAVGKERFC
jgi:hypothetical protein